MKRYKSSILFTSILVVSAAASAANSTNNSHLLNLSDPEYNPLSTTSTEHEEAHWLD